MHRGQNDKAFFVLFDEAIHWVVFVLIKADFLSNTIQVHAHWWIANHHLEAYFSHSCNKLFNLFIDCGISILNAECVLDILCYFRDELISDAAFHNAPPVALISFPQDTNNWTIKLTRASDRLEDLFSWLKMFLNCKHNGWEQVLVEEDNTFNV